VVTVHQKEPQQAVAAQAVVVVLEQLVEQEPQSKATLAAQVLRAVEPLVAVVAVPAAQGGISLVRTQQLLLGV